MALKVEWSKRTDKKFDRIIEYLTIEWGGENRPPGIL